MLEYLLVLGQIPDTNLVLSFEQVLLMALVLDCLAIWNRHLVRRSLHAPYRLMLLRRKAIWRLRLMGFSQLVRLTPRRVAAPQARTFARQLQRNWLPVRQAY